MDLKNTSVETLKSQFDIIRPFTAEEEAQVRKDNAWVDEDPPLESDS